MTEQEKQQEIELARGCFVEEFDAQLSSGKITQERHDELVAKVTAA